MYGEKFVIQKELNLKQYLWLEFLKDYEFTILFHLGKANMVVVALSRKWEVLLASMMVHEWKLWEDMIKYEPQAQPKQGTFVASVHAKLEILDLI